MTVSGSHDHGQKAKVAKAKFSKKTVFQTWLAPT